VFLPWISVVFDVSKQGDLGQLVCGSRPAPDQLKFDILKNISKVALSWRFPLSLIDVRLKTHNQNMTVAAVQMALMKMWAHRSWRVAMRRQSSSLPNMRSTRVRCL
jgi:hypothetical protein